jgi:transglutaminase-like putative cysteine protease
MDDIEEAICALVKRTGGAEGNEAAHRRVFRIVRDMEYATDSAHDAATLLRTQRGDCVAKSDLLVRCMQVLGIGARTVRWLYRLPDHPPEVQRLPSPFDVHTAVQVRSKAGGWLLLDATWDNALSHAGLPVAEWDGMHPTFPAFFPLSPIWTDREDPCLKTALAELQAVYEGREADAVAYRKAFNLWLDQLRSVGTSEH